MWLFVGEWRRESEVESGDVDVNCEKVPVLGVEVAKCPLCVFNVRTAQADIHQGRKKYVNIAC